MTIYLQKSDSGAFRQTIRVHQDSHQHTLFADVAAALGGDDSAPDPHDIFDASLAACKAITLLMYAKRKQLPLDWVDVEINRDNSQEAQGLYQLNVVLKLVGSLSDGDRQQLLAIADKCPIHKLMTAATVQVNTRLVQSGSEGL
ncbi:OsmC family peroxiredoxin [Rheinheimera riviphila]|uniref:OsmC family peroxiredoxin n=1 Tax=Rheinheimera riviphila TaxID=1834037 RepID=A0A437QR63_9GAMM|nr:OsmC family protein [Rheinheimera riviphila]RVU36992.1 OsmC family peroxiredoxin [Rheinheimera riviphila]